MNVPFRHVVHPFASGETCTKCGGDATHKVAEETDEPRHEFTAYVCCSCFGDVMGIVAREWCGQ